MLSSSPTVLNDISLNAVLLLSALLKVIVPPSVEESPAICRTVLPLNTVSVVLKDNLLVLAPAILV